MATDLEDTISDAAQAPAQVEADGLKVSEHSLPDLIEADQYLAGKTAATRKHKGIRFNRISPPGAG